MNMNGKYMLRLEELFGELVKENYDRDFVRTCVLEVFVFKYVHDYYYAKYNAYVKQFERSKNAKEWVERKMSRERFVLTSEYDYEGLFNYKGNNDLGKEINNRITELAARNKEKLDGLFDTDFQTPKMITNVSSNWQNILHKIVTGFRKIQLAGTNGEESYAYKVYKTILFYWPLTNSYEGAEYHFAPVALHELLIKLTSPQAGDRIYDPCCNIGSLLAAAGASILDRDNNSLPGFSLYGQTSFPEWARLSKILMLIQEIDDAQITIGDPINDPILGKDKKLLTYEVLISNLPWNIQDWKFANARADSYNRFRLGTPPDGKGDLAYIQHLIACSSDEGRIAVIIPNGVLFREGREYYIRRNIIENNLLEAVIGLPSNLFYSTKQSCAIMVLRKNKGENKNVLFVDASLLYHAGKRQNTLQEEDTARITDTYRSFQRSPAAMKTDYSSIVTPGQIEENDFAFTVSRYVNDAPANKKDISSEDLITDIKALEKVLAEIRNGINQNLQKLDQFKS